MIPKFVTEIGNLIISTFYRKLGLPALISIGTVLLAHFRYDPLTQEGYVRDTINIFPEYDFIIIGAGSAGSVVANRLTEQSNWNVLLLEAGGNENEIVEVPSLFLYLLGSSIDWKYKTEPPIPGQGQYCLAMNGKRCNWSRGKILGGTSGINAMLYVRGNKHDYNQWASLGNPGWSYEEILPYFLKSEDNQDNSLVNTRYHSKGGYLTVTEAPFKTPLVASYIGAGRELGYEVHNVNGEYQSGFMISQATMRDGRRCSTARAFLRPIRNRRNFHVSINSLVTKILIDPQTKTAYGVEFEKNGKRYRVRAKKEVILSAGTLASPQMLMLSGVGIREHLEEHNIPVIQELKVGDNLQDHYGLGGMSFTINAPVSVKPERLLNLKPLLQYITKYRGPNSGLIGECVAFLNTKYADKNIDWPDIQFDFAPLSLNADPAAIKRITNLRDDFFAQVYAPLGERDAFMLIPNIMRPKSRGFIRLRSSDPHDHPKIFPNYFGHSDDTKVLVQGVRLAYTYSQQNSFKRFNAQYYNVTMPGCENYTFDSDEFWECYLKHFTFTLWHFAGTCKMGPDSDPDAVVDSRLRVRGIKGLRVIDASVMPLVTTGNINAPVIMIGEKGSDMIKEDWKAF